MPKSCQAPPVVLSIAPPTSFHCVTVPDESAGNIRASNHCLIQCNVSRNRTRARLPLLFMSFMFTPLVEDVSNVSDWVEFVKVIFCPFSFYFQFRICSLSYSYRPIGKKLWLNWHSDYNKACNCHVSPPFPVLNVWPQVWCTVFACHSLLKHSVSFFH